MRNYTIDSPQAKARIIALALLADGGLDKSEIEYLDTRDIVDHLGIAAGTFDKVMHQFCEDVEQYGLLQPNGQLDLASPVIRDILDEVRQRGAREALLRTIFDIVLADRNLSLGEAQLTARAMSHWGIRRHELAPPKRSHLAGLPPHVRRAVAEACS
jgi:uncharacterized tellurite resistance protein B-like protein